MARSGRGACAWRGKKVATCASDSARGLEGEGVGSAQAELAEGFVTRRAEREKIAGLELKFAGAEVGDFGLDDRTGEMMAALVAAQVAERRGAKAELAARPGSQAPASRG